MDYILFYTNCLFCFRVLNPPENVPESFYYARLKEEVQNNAAAPVIYTNLIIFFIMSILKSRAITA